MRFDINFLAINHSKVTSNKIKFSSFLLAIPAKALIVATNNYDFEV